MTASPRPQPTANAQANLDQATAELALQDRLTAFIRAFGLHQPEQTPCGQPIPVSEAHALIDLARAPDQRLGQHQLTQRLRLQKSTVSRLVGQLERRGWLRREPHPDDGRATLLVLTPAGHDAAEQLARARRAKFAALLAAIPAQQRDSVLHALDTLVEALYGKP
jgi:DNA-binding MarR family transcriptional regulator